MREFNIDIKKNETEPVYLLTLEPVDRLEGPANMVVLPSEEDFREALFKLGGDPEGIEYLVAKLSEEPRRYSGWTRVVESVAESFGCPLGWPNGKPWELPTDDPDSEPEIAGPFPPHVM
jgi:hypothetical protein